MMAQSIFLHKKKYQAAQEQQKQHGKILRNPKRKTLITYFHEDPTMKQGDLKRYILQTVNSFCWQTAKEIVASVFDQYEFSPESVVGYITCLYQNGHLMRRRICPPGGYPCYEYRTKANKAPKPDKSLMRVAPSHNRVLMRL